MRRSELVQGLRELEDAVKGSEVLDALVARVRAAEPGEDPAARTLRLMEALRDYAIRASRFSPAGARVAEILGVDRLATPAWWIRLTASERGAEAGRALAADVVFAMRRIPQLVELLTDGAREIVRELAEGKPGRHAGRQVLSVVVLEPDGRYSTPERLGAVLESVSALYEASATLLGLPHNDLCVLACDSGSDKAFDFLGSSRVMDAVKDLIVALWDRVVLFREQPAAQRHKRAAETLPVLGRLRQLREDGALSPEQAELLRRRFVTGAGKFLMSGALIPEIRDRARMEPSAFLAPAPQLIGPAITGADAPPAPTPAPQGGPPAPSAGGLSDDERTLLKGLLHRLQQPGA
jgi:hypothetical protein